MSYNDKYPDMSAIYELQFREENRLKNKIKDLEKALEFITRISGAGMSYQDMFIDAHEVAKFALGQIKYPILTGRHDKEMTDLLRGSDAENMSVGEVLDEFFDQEHGMIKIGTMLAGDLQKALWGDFSKMEILQAKTDDEKAALKQIVDALH